MRTLRPDSPACSLAYHTGHDWGAALLTDGVVTPSSRFRRRRYESLNRQNAIGDFRFVVLGKFLSYENELPLRERFIMNVYFTIKSYTTPEDRWFGLSQ